MPAADFADQHCQRYQAQQVGRLAREGLSGEEILARERHSSRAGMHYLKHPPPVVQYKGQRLTVKEFLSTGLTRYAPNTVARLVRSGLTGEQIIERDRARV